jgi:hypothetical protein
VGVLTMRARNQVMAENIKTYATQYVTQHLNTKYFFGRRASHILEGSSAAKDVQRSSARLSRSTFRNSPMQNRFLGTCHPSRRLTTHYLVFRRIKT